MTANIYSAPLKPRQLLCSPSAAAKRSESMHDLDLLGRVEIGSAWKKGTQERSENAEQMLALHLTASVAGWFRIGPKAPKQSREREREKASKQRKKKEWRDRPPWTTFSHATALQQMVPACHGDQHQPKAHRVSIRRATNKVIKFLGSYMPGNNVNLSRSLPVLQTPKGQIASFGLKTGFKFGFRSPEAQHPSL